MPKLANISQAIPSAIIDMRYASSDNITGQPIYSSSEPLLNSNALKALKRVADKLSENDLRLVIWDAYRPPEAQKKLQAVCPDDRYVSKISHHCQGIALDITLANSDGSLLPMGTDHDKFNIRAHVDYQGVTAKQKINRLILSSAMEAEGFSPWPYEWWHFNYLKAQPKLAKATE